MDTSDGAWFAAKKFGYGAGFPIAWQGWAMLAVYILTAMGCGLLWETGDAVYASTGAALFLIATLALVLVAKAKTRGGWRKRP